MDLNGEQLTKIVAALASIAPLTAGVVKLLELAMKSSAQKHEIRQAEREQTHKMTIEYLSRALDPSTPLAIRNAHLRYLAAEATDRRSQLQVWATTELARLEPMIRPLEKEVEAAHQKVNAAKDSKELQEAEQQLLFSKSKLRELLEEPVTPLNASTIRAGKFRLSDLSGRHLGGLNLRGATLTLAKLQGTQMLNSDLTRAHFGNADLRGANLENAILEDAFLVNSDCRAAIFVGANLNGASFEGAHLEDADLTRALLDDTILLGATYNNRTKWPDGFDPEAFGATPFDKVITGDELPSKPDVLSPTPAVNR